MNRTGSESSISDMKPLRIFVRGEQGESAGERSILSVYTGGLDDRACVARTWRGGDSPDP